MNEPIRTIGEYTPHGKVLAFSMVRVLAPPELLPVTP